MLDILNDFNSRIDTNKSYTLNEMKEILIMSYKSKMEQESDEDVPKRKRGRPLKVRLDKDGNPKTKREPTKYNIFVGRRIKELKQEQPETSAIELMKIASSEWQKLSKEEKEM